VWRASEPGTPPPRQRIEAVRRLNDAGIPCGVLVAPILPGISDDEDRLEAVVEAVLAAGAVSITPIFLHLRPGVREVFMPWLSKYRPDLVHRYRKLYASSYATAAGARTSQLVEELVRKHGGVQVAAAGTRLAA
jgi:DNA repair photolyase